MKYLLPMIWALLITVVSEIIFVCIVTKDKTAAIISLLGNMVTNPIVNMVLSALLIWTSKWSWLYIVVLVLLETAAFFSETIFYKAGTDFGLKKCLLISLGANALSFGTGLMIEFILPIVR